MRVAFTGKGGMGKTAIVAMLARALAAEGRRVLAVDFDVNPGLELALGTLDGDGRLPASAAVAREGAQYGFELHPELGPRDAVARFAARGPDGIRMLSFGNIGPADHDLARTHMAVRQVAAGFDEPGWDVVVDMEAGTKDVFDGSYVAFVDLVAMVTDASPVGDLTCRRLASIAAAQGGPPTALVLNRATPERTRRVEALAAELSVPLLGSIPADDAVRRADVAGEAVADAAPGCPAMLAARDLARALRLASEGVRR